MKKGIVIAVLAVFSVFAVGPAFAAVGADGKLTIDKPAAKFPAKKLNADGTKKKNPVTFNHTKHGALGCTKCHHADADLKAGGTPAKLCFDCHGPEAEGQAGRHLRDDPRQDRRLHRLPQDGRGGHGCQGPDGLQGLPRRRGVATPVCDRTARPGPATAGRGERRG